MTANKIAQLFSIFQHCIFSHYSGTDHCRMRELTAWLYLLLFSTDAWDGVFAHIIGKDGEARRKLDSYGDVMYMIAGVVGFCCF